MKLYSSFLIRCWLIEDSQRGEKRIIDVEHIQSGGRTRAGSLTEAEGWMLEACRNTHADAQTARDDGREPKDGVKELRSPACLDKAQPGET